MKNTVVGILTLVIIGLMGYTAMKGGAYHGGEHGKIIADIKDSTPQPSRETTQKPQEDLDEDQQQLKELKDKAVIASSFEVSTEYNRKCSSCHGNSGEGILGPRLIGLKADDAYRMLMDYKSGRKPNAIMKGLLINLNEEDLRRFADEIGGFEAKAAAQP